MLVDYKKFRDNILEQLKAMDVSQLENDIAVKMSTTKRMNETMSHFMKARNDHVDNNTASVVGLKKTLKELV